MIRRKSLFLSIIGLMLVIIILPVPLFVVRCSKKIPPQNEIRFIGSLNTGRYMHSAILLNNNKVLVVSGKDSYQNQLVDAELFDPLTGMFTQSVGKQNVARQMASAMALLHDGRVFIGGFGTPEIFDPGTGVFTATAELPEERC